ncbi:efflux RND transporter periplasmic adaptor subunit [uncultured Dysosmobacter sp.]|uniref:efflux RND transporter periplasmic adaptor subunit n=1 Tax=uncultured Dysosmobacter sp. TaxID=2591384 RepID=UPI0026166F8F|nr:HlyD family efflux transporter periplasmic adaptor subunit [uncultured Dysosmobacter sp.]
MEETLREDKQSPPAAWKNRLAAWKPKLKGKKKWLVLVLLLACGGGFALKYMGGQQAETASVYQESAAEVRDITRSLTSSGTLQPADSYTVSTLLSSEILSDTFEEGDLVEKDQLLYTLDSSDANSSQTQAQNSYSQAQSNYSQAVKAKYPTADMSGTIGEVYVQNGDSVTAGTQICKIVGDNNIYIDFLFSYADNSDFYVGQSATIFIDGFAGTLTGTVQQVSQSTVASGNAAGSGRQMTTVRVKAVNPGLVTEDYTASAVIGNYSSYGQASIKVSASSIVTAEASGKISGLSLLAGDTVSNGQRLCTLTGDSVDNAIENARISLSNASTSLENTRDRLDDYQITAPISGTVVTKMAKAGDNVDGGSLCVIYDLSYLEMTMNIDELDIGDVAVGQTVQVTADAVEDQTYTGVVTNVSVAGTTTGGITTYPVTVRIEDIDGLLPGMNVDAEIIIDQRLDVLAIPSSAVNRGNTVLVTADSPSAVNALEQEAPEGYVYVQVETGSSDDSYIEITSGLQEGDVVAYIQTSSGGGMDFMMGGMPGGGMPSGGAPGGGMPSGGGPGGGGPGGGF